MKEIPLTQGKVALVDDDDYDEVSKTKWCALKDGQRFYAARNGPYKKGMPRKLIRMHNVINRTPDGLDTDHIDGNGLNNQKANLRAATRRENLQNIHTLKSSKYPGVCWDKAAQKWRAQIRINGRLKHLGYFIDEFEAAKTYIVATIVCAEPSEQTPQTTQIYQGA